MVTGAPAPDDVLQMSRALALAERGRGRTSPNPMVGALIIGMDGVVAGRGFHEFAGGPHAEVHALAAAGDRSRGATLYCTLEPCAHTGRTGPCAPLVTQAGIRRAVIALEDPNPLVGGRGLSHLREGGLEVVVGVLREEAAWLNAPFLTMIRRRRPFVTMKVALSRDRRVAAARGLRTALTGPAANRYIHRERAETDAIGVGSGTVLADDPLLTARGAYRVRPLVRVVFDRSLRTPPNARLLSTLDAGPIIVMSARSADPAAPGRSEALLRAGAQIECVGEVPGESFLARALARLGAMGITAITIEGGPTLQRALWKAGLVDRVQVFTTPAVLGPGGVPWLEDALFPPDAFSRQRTQRLGEDVLVEGYVHRAD